jgi:hypothetical protein
MFPNSRTIRRPVGEEILILAVAAITVSHLLYPDRDKSPRINIPGIQAFIAVAFNIYCRGL